MTTLSLIFNTMKIELYVSKQQINFLVNFGKEGEFKMRSVLGVPLVCLYKLNMNNNLKVEIV